MKKDVAAILDNCLTSPSVADLNGEPANVVDVIDSAAAAVNRLANAVTAPASPGKDSCDGHVECLTEAVMGITAGLVRIAEAIDGLAAAVRER